MGADVVVVVVVADRGSLENRGPKRRCNSALAAVAVVAAVVVVGVWVGTVKPLPERVLLGQWWACSARQVLSLSAFCFDDSN